jgi:hypothetical protein
MQAALGQELGKAHQRLATLRVERLVEAQQPLLIGR